MRARLYYRAVWLLYFALLADAATTQLDIMLGAGREAHVLLAPIEQHNPALMIIVIYVLATGIAITLFKTPSLLREPRRLDKIALVLLIPATLHFYAAANNLYVAITGHNLPPPPLPVLRD